ncbi:MAG: substrate-binding domain-containing protein [Dysgonamonadaceae bacterium]|jgi:LacI family transcriptional regulator|nr:substrate-binding domain-containing protein [Dysgonamonadaceae bacterium]
MKSIPEKIKIKDIAEKAGVSPGTVDRVLHNRGNVSEVSRKKVEEVLKHIDYTPNVYASALASKKSFSLLVVMPKYLSGDYWEKMEFGIARAAREIIDFRVSIEIIYFDQYKIDSFCQAMEKVLKKTPDGVLLTPSLKSVTCDFTCKLDQKKIPYVFVDSFVEEAHPLAYFGQHSHQSGYLGAKLLFTQKSDLQEIAVFSFFHVGQKPSNQISMRMAGFSEYVMEKRTGCKLHRVTLDAENPDQNEETMRNLFFGNKGIDGAIIFSSRAYVVADFLKKHNLNHITLIGYDLLDKNIVRLKDNTISYLIAQRPEEQGYKGIRALTDHLVFKKEIKPVNHYTPIDILTQENIDFYLEF